MVNKPLFSVLVANYNNERFIVDMVRSIQQQTYQHFEIVIVDDASTDNSVKVIESLQKYEPRIKLYQNPENKNCGFTKHRVADLAEGEILGYVDPDDTLEPDAIEQMVVLHAQIPQASIVHATHYVCDQLLHPIRLAYGAKPIPVGESYLTAGEGITHFATFKKNAYQKTAGINPTFKRAVDQDLYYKLEEVGEVYFLNKPLYKYRIHTGGISTYANLAKSRYWFLRAKEDAFIRRKKLTHIKNIDDQEIAAWWSIVYFSKASDAVRNNQICNILYWVTKGFFKSPVDKYFLYKLRILFSESALKRQFLKLTRKKAAL